MQQMATNSTELLQDRDAKLWIFVSHDKMTAEMAVQPPVGDGAAITENDVRKELAKNKVQFGIDDAVVAQLVSPLYGEKLTVARGVAAQHGVDGLCDEKFSREKHKNMQLREDGTVNCRELNLINEVKQGTLICECTAPTKGVAGTDVTGRTLPARDGKKALPAVGENITTTPDGLRSIAAVRGNLVFKNNRFVVETVYRVEHVDYDVGNISFFGDVQVNGDVMDGFEIHSGGTVTLRGQVSSTVIEAENIIIEKGINGNGKAILNAKNKLQAGFIENCNIFVGKELVAGYLMNCRVECEGTVDVSRGKGIISGGALTSLGDVRARVVGNESYTTTTIALGITPTMQKQRQELEAMLAEVKTHLEEMQKNINYIEQLVAEGITVPQDRVTLLQRYQIQMPMTEKKKTHIIRQIQAIDEKMQSSTEATLVARRIYPPTRVTIGTQTVIVPNVLSNSRVYRNVEGEVVFGRM